ncbi:exported protein of unknown function [Cupriavidus taiwanensis]|nr:exported protein of unknown function [Cupriavidus taiwanensis]
MSKAASASAQARSTSASPPPWKSGPMAAPVAGLIACSVASVPRTACAPISMSPVICMEGSLSAFGTGKPAGGHAPRGRPGRNARRGRRAGPPRAGLLRADLVDQRAQHLHLLFGQVGQRCAHGTAVAAHQARARLDDAHRIAGLAVADGQVGQEEVVDQAAHGVVVVRGDGAVEVHRRLRDEVEHRRRIHRHAQRLVGRGIDLGGGQAAQVGEAVAQLAADADHRFDVAHAILEADQVGAAPGQAGQLVGVELRIGAVVDDHADIDRLADFFHVGGNAVLAGLGQVVRQQQHAGGAQALGFLRVGDGSAGRAAGAGQDRHLAGAGTHRGVDYGRVVLRRQREELAGAAGREQRGGAVGGQPFQARGVGLGREVALGVEVGDGEGQQAFGDDLLEFVRCEHCGNPGRADGPGWQKRLNCNTGRSVELSVIVRQQRSEGNRPDRYRGLIGSAQAVPAMSCCTYGHAGPFGVRRRVML